MCCHHFLRTFFIFGSLLVSAAHAENRALIMGVSEYVQSPLPGVHKDIASAKELARAMNVPEANITVRKDRELTLAGLRRTLDEFTRKVNPGDRIFIYYSGHGTSYSKSSGQCEKAIVTQEMQVMPKEEFHSRLRPIIDRAAKTFVFLDTCFSGGVVDSSKGATRDAEGEVLRMKFTAAKLNSSTGDDPCARPSNYASKATRDFDVETAQETPNYYLLGAAGTSEYAIDGGSSVGSFATSAFLHCIRSDSGVDANGDGVITLQEARACAQRRVDGLIRPPFLAQTITEGNGPGGNTPLAFTASTATPGNPSLAASPAANNRINSQALLETIRQGADSMHQVTLSPTKMRYRIGTDFLEMDVTSSKGGYVTIFSVGSSGKIFQLFPNQHDRSNRIEANTPLRLPRPEWRIRANGPAGTDRFIAIISSTPDRFAGLGIPSGPFSKVENNAAGAKDIVERLITPAQACGLTSSGVRDFAAESNPCSSTYGAGMADVQEVN